MSCRAILVDALAGAATIALAAGLAGRFDAGVIGLAAASAAPQPGAPFAGALAATLAEGQARSGAARIGAAESAFLRIVRAAGARGDFHGEAALPAEAFARWAAAADLVVLGRGGSGDGYERADPADVVMQAGRPVLLVPAGLERLTAESVVVAWKDGREARRAVVDALPFLKRAARVTVLAIGEDGRHLPRVQGQLDAVAGHLRGHGVAAGTALEPVGSGSVADAIVRAAEGLGAALIVSGAYGGGRMREWVFGGVTQALIHDFDGCCLLSR